MDFHRGFYIVPICFCGPIRIQIISVWIRRLGRHIHRYIRYCNRSRLVRADVNGGIGVARRCKIHSKGRGSSLQCYGFPFIGVLIFLIVVKPHLHRTAHIRCIITLQAVGIVRHQADKLCRNRALPFTDGKFSTVFRREAATSLLLPAADIAAFIHSVKIIIIDHAIRAVFHNLEENIIHPYFCIAASQHKTIGYVCRALGHCSTCYHLFPIAPLLIPGQ